MKKILMSLVEPNRKLGRDVVSSSVKGWRFQDVDQEQYSQPGRAKTIDVMIDLRISNIDRLPSISEFPTTSVLLDRSYVRSRQR